MSVDSCALRGIPSAHAVDDRTHAHALFSGLVRGSIACGRQHCRFHRHDHHHDHHRSRVGVRARVTLARNGPALDEAGRCKPNPPNGTGPPSGGRREHRRFAQRRTPGPAANRGGVVRAYVAPAHAGRGRDRSGPGRQRPAGTIACGATATATRHGTGIAALRRRGQPADVAGLRRSGAQRAPASRADLAARRSRRIRRTCARQRWAPRVAGRLQRQRRRGGALSGLAGGGHPCRHAQQAGGAAVRWNAGRRFAPPAPLAHGFVARPPSVPACRWCRPCAICSTPAMS